MRICIIHNPNSGKHKSIKHAERISCALKKFSDKHQTPSPAITLFASSSIQILNDFMASKPAQDLFIIVGGDGTIGPVINAMKHNGITTPIYCLGRGTANDYASFLKTNCGYKRAAKIIAQNKTQNVDTLFIDDKTYACNVACGGAFTNGVTHYSKHAKRIFGKFAYFVQGFITAFFAKSQVLKFTVDNEIFEAKTFLFYILNTKNVGGLKNSSPLSEIDDGVLDLLVIKQCGIFGKMSIAFHQAFGTMHRCRHVIHIQGKQFAVEHLPNATPQKNFTITDIDGNPYAPYPLRVKIGTKITVVHK